MIRDAIEARLGELERLTADMPHAVNRMGGYFGRSGDAALAVTAVNLLPGVIAWARDVLARHPVAVSHEACDHETPGEECTTYEVCGACTNNEYEAEWPCPEVRAVAKALGVTE